MAGLLDVNKCNINGLREAIQRLVNISSNKDVLKVGCKVGKQKTSHQRTSEGWASGEPFPFLIENTLSPPAVI